MITIFITVVNYLQHEGVDDEKEFPYAKEHNEYITIRGVLKLFAMKYK